jgi:hypothetical protein
MQQTTTAVLDFTDLGEALLYEVEPPEQLIDALLYREGIHSVYSPGGTGKTILALWVALRAIEQGSTVLYIDEENGTYHITELLKHMGADPELVGEHFKYAPAPGLNKSEVDKWHRTVSQVRPDLVVFDSFADHLALDGLSENASTDVTGWIKAFAQPVKDAGGAVLILDHVAKDSGGKGARGSTAKLAKVDVAWKLTLDQPFNREVTGRITLSRDKDRKGAMPYSRTFEIGGDGCGTLVCKPDGIGKQPEPETLRGKHKQIYDTLISRFPDGARAGQLIDATGIPETTFYRVVKEIPARYVFKDADTQLYHTLPSLPRDSHGSSESYQSTLPSLPNT